MPLELPVDPAAPPDVDSDEPIVRVWRLDWSFINLEPEERASLPAGVDADGDTVYLAMRPPDAGAQLLRQIEGWLKEVPGSDVIVAQEEIPLSEWLGSFLGDAEDAEPQ